MALPFSIGPYPMRVRDSGGALPSERRNTRRGIAPSPAVRCWDMLWFTGYDRVVGCRWLRNQRQVDCRRARGDCSRLDQRMREMVTEACQKRAQTGMHFFFARLRDAKPICESLILPLLLLLFCLLELLPHLSVFMLRVSVSCDGQYASTHPKPPTHTRTWRSARIFAWSSFRLI